MQVPLKMQENYKHLKSSIKRRQGPPTEAELEQPTPSDKKRVDITLAGVV